MAYIAAYTTYSLKKKDGFNCSGGSYQNELDVGSGVIAATVRNGLLVLH